MNFLLIKPQCSMKFLPRINSSSNSMAISTVIGCFKEALSLSRRNFWRMALLVFVTLVPLEIFSLLIKGYPLFVVDLTLLINRKTPDFPFVVPKTKAEIRLGDLLISVLSTVLIAQLSCMARSNYKASLDYYIKGLQKIYSGSVATLLYAKLFYMLPILILTFLERNTRVVQVFQREKMLIPVLLLKISWMMLLPFVEQWSLVIILLEEQGINGLAAIAKASAFVGRRKGKVAVLTGAIMAMDFMALMVLGLVNGTGANLKVGKVAFFGPDSVAGDVFWYFVTFYTYLVCMVFYDKER